LPDNYQARQWAGEKWLSHAFGTRNSASLDSQTAVASLKQIHSNLVWATNGQGGCLGEGDALISREPGLILSIRTADCLPILIADPVGRAVAAVHAGWRGTVSQIATRTVEKMAAEFGSEAQNLQVAIGPGILKCCFEVGPEVAAQFGGPTEGKSKVDLVEANTRQLIDTGIPALHIEAIGLCTFCNAGEFHSFRRDAGPGRMVSWIGIR
jgi:YfiH family protein